MVDHAGPAAVAVNHNPGRLPLFPPLELPYGHVRRLQAVDSRKEAGFPPLAHHPRAAVVAKTRHVNAKHLRELIVALRLVLPCGCNVILSYKLRTGDAREVATVANP